MAKDEIIKQVLTFYVNDVIYGIELENVIETIRFQSITYVPYAYYPPFGTIGSRFPHQSLHMHTDRIDKSVFFVPAVQEENKPFQKGRANDRFHWQGTYP